MDGISEGARDEEGAARSNRQHDPKGQILEEGHPDRTEKEGTGNPAANKTADSDGVQKKTNQKEHDVQEIGYDGGIVPSRDPSNTLDTQPELDGLDEDVSNIEAVSTRVAIVGNGDRPTAALPDESPTRRAQISADLLQKATRSHYGEDPDDAINIPLPESIASSRSSGGNFGHSALPLEPSRQRLELRPEDVPLPSRKAKIKKKSASLAWAQGDSRPSKSKKKEATRSGHAKGPPIDTDLKNYRKNINRLAKHFPNFQNVAATDGDTRFEWKSRIVIHDRTSADGAYTTSRQEPFVGRSAAPAFSDFKEKLLRITDDCVQRVVLVEDLSSKLVDLLGATFDIAPHVFEEHLGFSGYRRRDVDTDTKKNTWNTRSNALGYSSVASVKWYRPVLPLIPIDQRFRRSLIRDQRPQVNCPQANCPYDEEHTLPLSATANIWRHFLELCPEPGTYHRGSRTEYPVGWEERVTIWKQNLDGCEFVIVLLDPLPVVAVNSREPREERLYTMGGLWIRKEITEHRSRPAGHMRKSQRVVDWVDATVVPPDPAELGSPPPLSPARSLIGSPLDPTSQQLTEHKVNKQPELTSEKSFAPAALRRRATRTDADREGSKFDPSALTSPPPLHGNLPVMRPKPPPPPPGILLPADPPSLPPPSTALSLEEVHGPFVPYHPIKARSSTAAQSDATFVTKHVRAYIESLRIPKSTLDELDYYLCLPTKGKETSWDPLRALFRAIHDDTHSLVDVVRTSLQRIREGTLDEDLMQKRVTFWRGLLHRLSYNLAELDQKLRAFAQFVHEPDTKARDFELPSEKLVNETRQTLKDCGMLIDRSSQSLLTEMQIVDSRRSIAEAESVSKLTELAFVFIPLSFVASLFSMQVYELEGGVPAYRFALVAIGFVGMAYTVRLSIRSSHLIDYKNRVFAQIRYDSRLQYKESIPTHTVLSWVGLHLGGMVYKSTVNFILISAPMILLIALVMAMISPIVLLWLRGIDKGFSAVITVILLLLDAALFVPIAYSASDKIKLDPRDRKGKIKLYPREVFREIRKQRVKLKRRKAGLEPDTTDESGSGSDDENKDV